MKLNYLILFKQLSHVTLCPLKVPPAISLARLAVGLSSLEVLFAVAAHCGAIYFLINFAAALLLGECRIVVLPLMQLNTKSRMRCETLGVCCQFCVYACLS